MEPVSGPEVARRLTDGRGVDEESPEYDLASPGRTGDDGNRRIVDGDRRVVDGDVARR